MEFGCIKSSYDSRDYTILKSALNKSELPDEFIINLGVDVKNQRNIKSCVAHAMSTILEFYSYPRETLSTNFIYGIQKEMFNREIPGMMLRDACKIAATYGDMLEEDCPGNTEVPNCHSIASESLDDEDKAGRAYKYRISKYYKCNSIKDVKYALVNHGPVLGALDWYSTYKVSKDGILSGDKTGSKGGHAFVIYGYNKTGFICQNSWGKYWGKNGRFIIPYDIKLSEARGIVDWDNISDLKQPKTGTFFNLIYKCINGLANLVAKVFPQLIS